jgi:hypothetical protein
MLYRDPTNLSVDIEVNEHVFINISGFSYWHLTQFDIQRVGILEVFYFSQTE